MFKLTNKQNQNFHLNFIPQEKMKKKKTQTSQVRCVMHTKSKCSISSFQPTRIREIIISILT